MNKPQAITIVIPNYNGKDLLEKNLPSVLAAAGKAEIIIVDDASTDDSIQFVKQKYPQIVVIRKSKNQGFSSTVNLGVSKASGGLIVLLNTDTQPEEHFLKFLIPHFENPNIFAVGCMDKSIERGKVVLRGRGESAWQHGFFVHRRGEINSADTAWVSCGSSMFRRSLWTQLGGLDEIYNPYYWEDIDLSYRARKAGFEIRFESKSIVKHIHEEGSIKKFNDQRKITKIAYRNQLLFIWKNITDSGYLREHWMSLSLFTVSSLLKGNLEFIYGLVGTIPLLRRVINGRQRVRKLFIKQDGELVSRTFS